MVPEPKYGEIEIRGKRWRWFTVGHFRGSGQGRARPTVRWSVSFRDPDDPARRYWCEIPEGSAERLTDQALRNLFEEARTGA